MVTAYGARDYSPESIDALLAELDAAMRGAGAPVWLSREPMPTELPGEIVVALATSGSTGAPRTVLFDTPCLQALTGFIHAGHDPVWIASLPFTGIGGLNVFIRSLATSHPPVVTRSLVDSTPFTPEVFADAVEQALPGDVFASLVPTQLYRLLESSVGRQALDACTKILVGGAAVDPSVTSSRIISTYGMTETSGGCVLNGVPAPDVSLDILNADESGEGTIQVSGPTIAWGYLGEKPFMNDNGGRVFRTHDRGRFSSYLEVLGRNDDVVQVKGVNVSVGAAQQIANQYGVIIVPVPHRVDGTRLFAVADGAFDNDQWTTAVERIDATLGAPARPRFFPMEQLPLTSTGKVDVRTIAQHIQACTESEESA